MELEGFAKMEKPDLTRIKQGALLLMEGDERRRLAKMHRQKQKDSPQSSKFESKADQPSKNS